MNRSATTADRAAQAVVEDHREELRRFLTALVGPDQAEDVIQDAWLRLRRVLAESAVEHPKALLFRIASNLACDELRRRQRQGGLLREAMPAEPPQAHSASDQALLDEQLVRVDHAVKRLPERCRQVFLMKRVEGLSYREIASHLSISEKTVENQITRALKLIREQMQDD